MRTLIDVHDTTGESTCSQPVRSMQTCWGTFLATHDLGSRVMTWLQTQHVQRIMSESLHGLPQRPSDVKSCRGRGIIDSIACMEPLVFGYGRGAMDGFPMDPELPLDIVPVDTSINAILAALAATAGRPGVHVYQIGTSHCNPLGAAPTTTAHAGRTLARCVAILAHLLLTQPCSNSYPCRHAARVSHDGLEGSPRPGASHAQC